MGGFGLAPRGYGFGLSPRGDPYWSLLLPIGRLVMIGRAVGRFRGRLIGGAIDRLGVGVALSTVGDCLVDRLVDRLLAGR
jgi:hypothetical protein